MFGTQDLWLFALTVLVLNATPGVDLLFTLTRTLQWGVRGGAAAALGIGAGCVLHTLAAAFGLAALLAASSAAFNLVKWAGALYLLWLAWGMAGSAWHGVAAASPSPSALPGAGETLAPGRERKTPARAAAHPDSQALRAIFRQGLLTNALNPKVALFFLALLPQFIGTGAPNKEAAFLFLGAWFVVQGSLFLLLFVVCVAPLRHWAVPGATLRGLHAGGAVIFATLASRLALAQRN
jgi:threonine/homoserine/homoserine lactone efflux protein